MITVTQQVNQIEITATQDSAVIELTPAILINGAGGATVTSVNGKTGVVVLSEEEIDGTSVEDATLTGSESIDLSTHADAYYTLTGNTSISVTNTPAAGESFVKTWTIKSSVAETLTLPVGWVIIGTYLNTGVENYLTIIFSNHTTAGAKVVCYINQDD